MRIIVLCNSDVLALPAIAQLLSMEALAAVVVPWRSRKILLPALEKAGVKKKNMYALTKEDLEPVLEDLVEKYDANSIYVMTFPWKLTNKILDLPAKGCYNFHFGLLPKYKGTDPIFWQIKNREAEGGITVHLMTGDIDCGPCLLQQKTPIVQGENYGIHGRRLATLLVEMLPAVNKMLEETPPVLTEQEVSESLYFKAPGLHELGIDWNKQTAEEIISLVDASNPRYMGAWTSIRQNKLSILEVSPAEVSNAQEAQPGTIVYADELYGVIVQCIQNKFLRITIAQLAEGIISGSKLFRFGFVAGEKFD